MNTLLICEANFKGKPVKEAKDQEVTQPASDEEPK